MIKLKTLPMLLLRVVIGWHLLYEGLSKLLTPGWTAQGYLEGSYGFMSGFFHSLAANSSLMPVVDFLNIWGLILIGTGLFIGVLLRFSAVAGMLLLMLYYFAYPPFGTSLYPNYEGHYWIINRNLIETIALLTIFFVPAQEYSIMYLFKRFRGKIEKEKIIEQEVPENSKRRELLKGLATLPFFGGVVYASVVRENLNKTDATSGATSILEKYNLKDLKGFPPKGKLGNLQVSRIIAGCNQIGGYGHARDLAYVGTLFRHYNTDSKIFETFELFDRTGINTVNMINTAYPILNKYLKATGSKMQSICQANVDARDPLKELKMAVDFGATSIYIQGGTCDILVRDGRLDIVNQALEYIRSQGLLAGVGNHSIQGPIACEKAGIKPDYYFKTMHHDNYWSANPREFRKEFCIISPASKDHNGWCDNIFDIFPEQTVEFFSKIDIPLIGFKVMAGGAISPASGFRYAFENGADFICVGMFDFQVVQDVNLIIKILSSDLKRTRPWYS
jgi:uncharacterized membrane protein YphA (DoxX/SURF4 family)